MDFHLHIKITCLICGVNQLVFFRYDVFYFPDFIPSLFLNVFLVLLFFVNVYFQSIERLILFVDSLTGSDSVLWKIWGNSDWVVKCPPCIA
jgi:hypothetical protein